MCVWVWMWVGMTLRLRCNKYGNGWQKQNSIQWVKGKDIDEEDDDVEARTIERRLSAKSQTTTFCWDKQKQKMLKGCRNWKSRTSNFLSQAQLWLYGREGRKIVYIYIWRRLRQADRRRPLKGKMKDKNTFYVLGRKGKLPKMRKRKKTI